MAKQNVTKESSELMKKPEPKPRKEEMEAPRPETRTPGNDAGAEEQSRSLSETRIPPLIQKGQEAFRRDLPELLEKHMGKWVAYSGEERIGIRDSKIELISKCFERGLRDDEFVVRGIAPEAEDIIDPSEWLHV